MSLDAQNLNFAIPSKYLKTLLIRSEHIKTFRSKQHIYICRDLLPVGKCKVRIKDDYVGAIADYTVAIRLKQTVIMLGHYNNRGSCEDKVGTTLGCDFGL